MWSSNIISYFGGENMKLNISEKVLWDIFGPDISHEKWRKLYDSEVHNL
jgi:hypothetical protein